MDSIEATRLLASRLHFEAVSRGSNPYSAYRFACEEAFRREIKVVKVSKGDVRLRGGQAVFDPDAFLILHQDNECLFNDAFLVAHELGHVELDGVNELNVAISSDQLRTSEASPTGSDRVVDYSHRQRREIQMDLFARDFLLPRVWLKELHLAGGLTASEIASKVDAPFPLVVQQLLDALLLPAIVQSPNEVKKVNFALNKEQEAAVVHRGAPLLLEAGPGSGKTGALVDRIESLLNEGVDPAKILVLTFSNKAAGELVERVMVRRPEAVQIWIGTFHSFGLDIVRRFHDQLKLPADPRLLDRTEALEMLENIYPSLDLKIYRNLWDPTRKLSEILNAISRANDEVVNAAGYHQLAMEMSRKARLEEEVEAANRHLEIAKVFWAYEQLKLELGCVDFGDLITMPVWLCESSREVCAHISSAYEHVLVDEYQDVNRSSVRLLRAIAGDGNNLWAVGDAKQSIYRFRGASSFNMHRFGVTDFSSGVRAQLQVNYRSTQEIVDSFSIFASGMKVVNSRPMELVSNRGKSGEYPQHLTVCTAEDETRAVADKIEELRREGHSYRDQAVLCSGNDRLAKISAGLEKLGVPVLNLGTLFERPEIRDLLSLLSLLVDRRAVGLVRTATIPGINLSLTDCDLVLTYLQSNELKLLEWFEKVETIPGVSDAGRASLRNLRKLLEDFEPAASPWEVVGRLLFDRTRWAAAVAESKDSRAQTQGIAIWQFMNFLRNQPVAKGLPIRRLIDRIRRLVLLADERELRQLPACASGIDAVRIMTMHGSKGLEFPVVHIPGLNAGSLPQYTNQMLSRVNVPPDGLIEGSQGSSKEMLSSALDEEQECLFFVALSRAQDRLFLYSSEETTTGATRTPSAFLSRLGNEVKQLRRYSPIAQFPENDAERIPIEIEGKLSFTDHQLQLYNKCPRRFFYTHVLGISARRTDTAFMKLHSAVQDLVDAFGADLKNIQSPEEIKAKLKLAFSERELDKHGCSSELFGIGYSLIETLVKYTSKHARHEPEPMKLRFGDIEIVVVPDQLLTDGGGCRIVRRVRTGHEPYDVDKNLSVALLQIAAHRTFPGAKAEIAYLSDGIVQHIKMSERVMTNRASTVTEVLRLIEQGIFPVKEDSKSCPLCPAYFVCSNVPKGEFSKKLSPIVTA